MPFDITPDIGVKRDADGHIRALHHPRRPYRAARTAFAAAAGTPSDYRSLADEYLRENQENLQLDDNALMSLAEDIAQDAAALKTEEARLRFLKTKKLARQATVSYAQTVHGIPLWEAGVTVRLKGPVPAVTGSQSTIHYGVDVGMPAPDAEYLEMNLAKLKEVLEFPDSVEPTFNDSRLWVYRFDSQDAIVEDESSTDDMHEAHPRLLPRRPQGLEDGAYYVVAEALFTLDVSDGDDMPWSVLIECHTGAVARLRALVGCVDGLVYATDPVTKGSNVRATSNAAVLNPFRDEVELPGLDQPLPPANQQRLRGEYVRLVNVIAPNTPAPTQPAGSDFRYSVPTHDFSAVNAYYHCDRLFRMMREMGFNVTDYFDGTDFPVRVDHRVSYSVGGVMTANVVNASAPGNSTRTGSDGFRFALALTNTNVGISVDWRVVLHEFGHTILWDNVHGPNFRFAHSAGDSLAAILNDVDSSAADRGRTFPWSVITRRHDRRPSGGWAFGGFRDDSWTDRAGYVREQILSSTMFRLYQALGGAADDEATRRHAARYTAFLIFSAIGNMTPVAQAEDGEEFAEYLMDADLANDTFEGQSSGYAHKVIRWAFERQGAYQPPGAPNPVTAPGVAPAVDVFLNDGRGGHYEPSVNWRTESADIWNRRSDDGNVVHEEPRAGRTNHIYVRVHNRGSDLATGTRLEVYLPNGDDPRRWPADFVLAGTLGGGDVPTGSSTIVGPIEWTPTESGPTRLLAAVSATGDHHNLTAVAGTIDIGRLVHCDNNLGMRAVQVEAAPPAPTPPDPGPGSVSYALRADPNVPIPDNNPLGVSSRITATEPGTIRRIAVTVDILHTWIGDLRVHLTSPGGIDIVLHDQSGGSRDNLRRTFDAQDVPALDGLAGTDMHGNWRLTVADRVGYDIGTLVAWSLDIEVESAMSRTEVGETPNEPIPDDDATGIISTVNVPVQRTVADVKVEIDIRHTYRGDLLVALDAPDGTTVVLHDRTGFGADNLIRTYSTANLPDLATLNGGQGDGDWSLRVADTVGLDTGTLRMWKLTITWGP